MNLHGHPQKTDYKDDGSDWPILSSQGHWRPGNDMPSTFPIIPIGISTADPSIAHTHIDIKVPLFGEITGPLKLNCTIKAFHTKGSLSGIYSPLGQIRDVIYEDTGTSTPPSMIGDPMGVKQWNVNFIFDPHLVRPTFPPTNTVPPHGWFTLDIAIKTFFDNGDILQVEALRTMYSMLDPTAPEVGIPDAGLQNGTACAVNNKRFKFPPETGLINLYGSQMGQSFSTTVGMIPLAPIQEPWSFAGFFYSYAQLEGVPSGKFKFPDGTFALRKDLDLHNGIPGIDIVPSQHFQGNTSFSNTPIIQHFGRNPMVREMI